MGFGIAIIVAGVAASLAALGVVPLPPRELFATRFGKVLGPLLIVFGALEVAGDILGGAARPPEPLAIEVRHHGDAERIAIDPIGFYLDVPRAWSLDRPRVAGDHASAVKATDPTRQLGVMVISLPRERQRDAHAALVDALGGSRQADPTIANLQYGERALGSHTVATATFSHTVGGAPRQSVMLVGFGVVDAFIVHCDADEAQRCTELLSHARWMP